ncbi:MAG: hypothetical protein AAGB32_02790 [Pseudomonadota bacterium]
MINLSADQRQATQGPEDVTADLSDIAKTEIGKIVVLSKGPDAVYPDGETAEYFGALQFMDMSGTVYAADMDVFDNTYDRLKFSNGVTVYAAKSLGNEEARKEAFVNLAAKVVTQQQNDGTTAILSTLSDDEMTRVKTIAQRGIGIGARDDCSATGTKAAGYNLAA